jgi:hypothetical protein
MQVRCRTFNVNVLVPAFCGKHATSMDNGRSLLAPGVPFVEINRPSFMSLLLNSLALRAEGTRAALMEAQQNTQRIDGNQFVGIFLISLAGIVTFGSCRPDLWPLSSTMIKISCIGYRFLISWRICRSAAPKPADLTRLESQWSV